MLWFLRMDTALSLEIWLATLVLAGVFLLLFLWALGRGNRARADLTQVRDLLAQAQTGSQGLNEALNTALRERDNANTRAALADQDITRLRTEQAALQQTYADTNRAREAAEKDALQARTERQEIQLRMADWEKAQAQSIEAAKAATLDISSHLLTQYKQEAAATKETSDKTEKETTDALRQHFETVAKSVSVLGNQVAETRGQADTIMRALSTPGGAGQFGEVGLENTLKTFGLVPGRDFAMQQSMRDDEAGRMLRPDALVFLPGETVLVIDSKSSKFLLDAARAEGEEQEIAALKNFAQTMRTQLRSLAGKDYQAAVKAAHKRAGRSGNTQRIVSVMCLPTEAALEKLAGVDPTFEDAAQQFDILVCGPMGLRALIGLSRWQVDLGLRAENQELIEKSIQQLLDSTVTVLSKIEGVGRGLQKASNDYSALVSSLNGRFLPRAKRLVDLGVRPSGHAQLKGKMPDFRVVTMDDGNLIDAGADDVAEQARLPSTES